MTQSTIDAEIAAIGKDILRELRNWLQKHNVDKGSDQYYWHRVDCATPLDSHEVATAKEIVSTIRPGEDVNIVETAAGFGQLSLCLSRLGYKTFPVEMQHSRHVGSVKIAQRIGAMSCKPILAAYPRQYKGPAPTVLLATNTIHGSWAQWDLPESEKWLACFLGCRTAIIDLERWAIHRPQIDDRLALAESVARWTGTRAAPLADDRVMWRFDRVA